MFFFYQQYTKQRKLFLTEKEIFKEKGGGGLNKKTKRRPFNYSRDGDKGPLNINKKAG